MATTVNTRSLAKEIHFVHTKGTKFDECIIRHNATITGNDFRMILFTTDKENPVLEVEIGAGLTIDDTDLIIEIQDEVFDFPAGRYSCEILRTGADGDPRLHVYGTFKLFP